MKLARTIHFDESDQHVYARPAASGEWAVSGGFEFSNWTGAELAGSARQAFANGWLGTDSFGRATFVAVTRIELAELDAVCEALARHFVSSYGAPDLAAAMGAAGEEVAFMQELCAGHEPNTLLAVARELAQAGVRERFHSIAVADAEIDLVAVHGRVE